jgi:hypothetical protein
VSSPFRVAFEALDGVLLMIRPDTTPPLPVARDRFAPNAREFPKRSGVPKRGQDTKVYKLSGSRERYNGIMMSARPLVVP